MFTGGARRGLERIVDVIGEILAFFTVILLIFMMINGAWNFLGYDLTRTFTYILFVSILLTIGLKGLEFALKNSLILTIVFAALLVAAVIVLVLPMFTEIPQTIPGWFPLNEQ